MAIISKIRERSGLVVGVVALALVLFIVGGDILSNNSIIMGSRVQKVGVINGHDITLPDYQNEIKVLENDYALQQNKNPDEAAMNGIREQAWNQLVFQHGYKDEIKKLGLEVTEEEQVDMVQGNNIHPAIKGSFTDPKTGKFDKGLVENFLRNIEQAAQKNQQAAQQYASWINFERKLPDDRLRTKYENMLKVSTYVTKEEAKREYQNQTAKAELKYLFVPYNLLPDSLFKPSDQELADYLNQNKNKYKSQDSRTIDYVQFMIKPSGEDSAYFQNELNTIKTEFATAENDTLFAAGKSDSPGKLSTYAVNELPANLSPIATTLAKGQVYGPFVQGSNFSIFKVVDILNEGAYSAKASHILFKWKSTSDADKKECLAQATKILNEIKGGKSFEEMARIHGTDGTASQGGDLGWFGEGRMVKLFQEAVFNAKSKGLLPKPVETEFGYHLIKVTETKTNLKYKVVSIEKNISAGDKTREEIFGKANKFKAEAISKETFESVAKKDNMGKPSTAQLQKNGNNVNDMQEARQIIRWAFNDAKVGDVSEVFELNDRYVVAVLIKLTEEGTAKVEDVKDQLTAEVRKKLKAAKIIEKLKGNTFEEMATSYGPGAVANTVPEATFSASALQDVGYDPIAVGKAFGLKPGATIKPFAAENGVAAFTLVKITPAPEIADYNTYKTQVEQRRSGSVQYFVGEAIKTLSKIKDERVKFF